MSKMKVTQIHIKNVYGLDELEISPGNITTISGKNGKGKSSALKALQNAIGGGSLAELRNVKTDDNPEIVLHLEGTDGEYIIKKTQNATTVKKQVGDTAAFEDVKSPQRWLNSIFDGKLASPIEFLSAKPKDRVDLMLRAIDLEYDEDELWRRMGLNPDDFPKVGDGVHPLNAIEFHRENIFDRRRGVNRDEKQKRAASDQMLRSIPGEKPAVEDIHEKEVVLEGMLQTKAEEKERAEQQLKAEKQQAVSKFDAAHNAVKSELQLYEEQLHREVAERIQARREETDKIIAECRAESDAEIQKAAEVHDKQMEAIDSMQPTIDELRNDISTMKERQKQCIEIDTIKQQANVFEMEAEHLKIKSNELTEALSALDAYKAFMCSSLPIEGLEINDKQIYVDGVKWDMLNTAKQIEIAVKVATLRGKDMPLPIVMVDGAESLDSESLELMRQHLEKEGVQAFIGRVTDGNFEVV